MYWRTRSGYYFKKRRIYVKAKFTAKRFSDSLSFLVAVIVWLIIFIYINLPYTKTRISNY